MSNPNFIDYCKIFCASGAGGDGSAHLHRAKYIPKGGPDGGDGGRGGHVILRTDSHLWTLLHLKYHKHFRAEDGEKGGKNTMHGANAKDIYIDVPIGTIVKNAETGEVVCDMLEAAQEFILCRGGEGGLGNDHFKSAENQTPREFTPGEPGQEGWFIFELKVLADVGLVGFPNAGKSTLLSALSAAKPEIADYPFTTMQPQLGVVAYRGKQSFVMADIPGIIEGAHEGRGLGLRFLRHIERNSVLLFMIPCTEEDPGAMYRTLLSELKEYNPELLSKPRMVAVTKCDLSADLDTKSIRRSFPPGLPVVFISAVSCQGLERLKDEIWKEINQGGEQ